MAVYMEQLYSARVIFAWRHLRTAAAPHPPVCYAPGTSYSKGAVMAALQATGYCPEPTCGRSKDQLKMIKNAMLRNVSA